MTEADFAMKVTRQEMADIREALRHAMKIEHDISRSEMHQGPYHEQSKKRYDRYEALYAQIVQALEATKP